MQDLDAAQRQMLVLALALMVEQRPGWEFAARQIASQLGGRDQYEKYLDLRKSRPSRMDKDLQHFESWFEKLPVLP